MFKFKGDKCQYCQNDFNENDDIVVCPECGSPYHRECFQKSGRCVREDLHESGQSYVSVDKDEEKRIKIDIRCPRCNEINDIDRNFCGNCGFPIKRQLEGEDGTLIPNSLYVFNADEELEDGVTIGDVSAYLGQNSGYFISKYKNMKRNKAPISINFSALFFNYMYLIYRKGFVTGIIIALILGVLNLPSTFLALSEFGDIVATPEFSFMTTSFIEKMEIISNYTQIFSFVIEILIAVFFNWFYMRYAIRKVKNLKNIYGSDFGSVATKRGGVLGRKIVFILFLIYMAIITLSQLSLLFL